MEYLSWRARSNRNYKYTHQTHCIQPTCEAFSLSPSAGSGGAPVRCTLPSPLPDPCWRAACCLSAWLLQGCRWDPAPWWLLFQWWTTDTEMKCSEVPWTGQAVGRDDSCKSLPTEIMLFYSVPSHLLKLHMLDMVHILGYEVTRRLQRELLKLMHAHHIKSALNPGWVLLHSHHIYPALSTGSKNFSRQCSFGSTVLSSWQSWDLIQECSGVNLCLS